MGVGVVWGGGMGLCGAGNKADQKRIHSWVGQPESVHTFGLYTFGLPK